MAFQDFNRRKRRADRLRLEARWTEFVSRQATPDALRAALIDIRLALLGTGPRTRCVVARELLRCDTTITHGLAVLLGGDEACESKPGADSTAGDETLPLPFGHEGTTELPTAGNDAGS